MLGLPPSVAARSAIRKPALRPLPNRPARHAHHKLRKELGGIDRALGVSCIGGGPSASFGGFRIESPPLLRPLRGGGGVSPTLNRGRRLSSVNEETDPVRSRAIKAPAFPKPGVGPKAPALASRALRPRSQETSRNHRCLRRIVSALALSRTIGAPLDSASRVAKTVSP